MTRMLVSGVTIVFHLLVPAMLLLWQWLGVDRSRAAWSLKTLAAGSYPVLLLLAGVWVALPWYLGYLYLGLWATVGVWQYRRLGAEHSRSSRRFRAIISGAAAALFMAGSIHAWMGHRPFDKEHVDLAFPLRGGTYYVISGGSNALMNLHFKTLTDERFHRYRGQSYAVDIVKLNRYGIRSSSPWPRELADYEIFGDAVYAPCGHSGAHRRLCSGPRSARPRPSEAGGEFRCHRLQGRSRPPRASKARKPPDKNRRSRHRRPEAGTDRQFRKHRRASPSHPRRATHRSGQAAGCRAGPDPV